MHLQPFDRFEEGGVIAKFQAYGAENRFLDLGDVGEAVAQGRTVGGGGGRGETPTRKGGGNLGEGEEVCIHHKGGEHGPVIGDMPTLFDEFFLAGGVAEEFVHMALEAEPVEEEHLFPYRDDMDDHQVLRAASPAQKFGKKGEGNAHLFAIGEDNFVLIAEPETRPTEHEVFAQSFFEQLPNPAAFFAGAGVVKQVCAERAGEGDVIGEGARALGDLRFQVGGDEAGDGEENVVHGGG